MTAERQTTNPNEELVSDTLANGRAEHELE